MSSKEADTELSVAVDDEKKSLIVEAKADTANVPVVSFRAKDYFPAHSQPPPRFSILMSLISIFLYFLGYALAANLLYDYATNEEWKYFAYTLVCIFIPTLVIQLFSYKLHCDHNQVNRYVKIYHIFSIGPAYRHWMCFKYGIKCNKRWKELDADPDREKFDIYKTTIETYLQYTRDVDLLSFIYSFLESGPQVTLQLYILLAYQLSPHQGTITVSHAKGISVIAFNIGMVAKSMAFYKQSLRKASGTKLAWIGFTMQLIYRIMLICSRVLTLVVFATVFHRIVFGVLGFHFLMMYFWLNGDKTKIFTTKPDARFNNLFEILAKVVFAVIFTFCYITTVEGDTMIIQSNYYLLFFAENISMMGVWMFMNGRSLDTYEIVATSLVFSTSLVGIVLLAIFYKFFHPKLKRQSQTGESGAEV